MRSVGMGAVIDDPLLGRLAFDETLDGCGSDERPVGALRGHRCRFVLVGYTAGDEGAAMRDAVGRPLAAGPSLLGDAEPHIVA